MQTFLINNWHQGDFGIELHSARFGYSVVDTPTSGNGRVDRVSDLSSSFILSVLQSQGLVAQPLTNPGSSTSSTSNTTSGAGLRMRPCRTKVIYRLEDVVVSIAVLGLVATEGHALAYCLPTNRWTNFASNVIWLRQRKRGTSATSITCPKIQRWLS